MQTYEDKGCFGFFPIYNGGILSPNLLLCIDHLRGVLSRDHIHHQAVAAGFIRRRSKLNAESFLGMLLYCSSQEDSSSLCSMCSVLEDHFGVELRKQSLDARFTTCSLTFVKSVLSELLEEQLQTLVLFEGDFWKQFTCVRIKDSTKFKVPDSMSEYFKGNGGSLAGICIQYEYDLATGKILDLRICSGGGNDRTEALKTKEHPGAGELVIRDLEYYALEVFHSFASNQVFFLSRLYPKTCVFEQKAGEWLRVDFHKIYQKILRHHICEMEMNVALGNEYKLPVRMRLRLVDNQVYEKRIREREKENRKRGQKLSEEVRIRYRFTIHITNATQEKLPGHQVDAVYKLRWQIELNFNAGNPSIRYMREGK